MYTAKLRDLLMNENGFAFDPSTGYTYNVNPVGVEVIGWLKEGCDEAELTRRLTAEYDVDAPTAQRDLEAFLGALQRNGLLPQREEVLV